MKDTLCKVIVAWLKAHCVEIAIAIVASLILLTLLYFVSIEEGGKFIATVNEDGTPTLVEIDKGSAFLEAIDRDSIRTLILLLAGIVGWYFRSRRTKALERSAEAAQKNAEIANRNAEATEQGLATERFVQAMNQLASDSPSIRTGGILGLERIANSQEEERDRIIRILSARIRELAPKRNKEPKYRDERLDIETAVKALSRIAAAYTGERKSNFCDLSNTDLRGLFFEGYDLSFFRFASANLTNVFIIGVDLTKAYLWNADLTSAKLWKNNLTNASLEQIRTIVKNLDNW